MNLRLPVDMLRWLFVVVNVVLLASAGMSAVQFFSERPEKELDLVLADTERFIVPEEVRRSADRQTNAIIGWVNRTKPIPRTPKEVVVDTPVVEDVAEGGPLAAANWVIDGMIGSSKGTSYAYLRKDEGEKASPSPRSPRRPTRRANRRINPRVGASAPGGPTTKITARSGHSFYIDETEYFCDSVDALEGKVFYRTSVDSQPYVLSREGGESALVVEDGIRQLKGGESDEIDPNAPRTPTTPPSQRGSFEQRENAPKVSNNNAARARRRDAKQSATVERNIQERRAAARRQLERQRNSVTPEAKAALERLKESGVKGEKYERLRERIESGEEIPELSKEFRESKEGQKQAEREGSTDDAERIQNNRTSKRRGGGR